MDTECRRDYESHKQSLRIQAREVSRALPLEEGFIIDSDTVCGKTVASDHTHEQEQLFDDDQRCVQQCQSDSYSN